TAAARPTVPRPNPDLQVGSSPNGDQSPSAQPVAGPHTDPAAVAPRAAAQACASEAVAPETPQVAAASLSAATSVNNDRPMAGAAPALNAGQQPPSSAARAEPSPPQSQPEQPPSADESTPDAVASLQERPPEDTNATAASQPADQPQADSNSPSNALPQLQLGVSRPLESMRLRLNSLTQPPTDRTPDAAGQASPTRFDPSPAYVRLGALGALLSLVLGFRVLRARRKSS
ncbi:MAG: hypothetical protein M3069_24385, partial [Chloroflexota bacterium]|nr:hypothetical protein [Chloroflexota bacterium]